MRRATSKIGELPIRLHRPILDKASIKQVTVKKEQTGKWSVTFGVEVDQDPPAKLENPEKVADIDIGISKYTHDTDGLAVESLDLSDERKGTRSPLGTSSLAVSTK